MQRLLQTDPRWSYVTMGESGITLGKAGCTTTCIAMASDYFGCYKTPGQLAKLLKYTQNGLLVWQSIAQVLDFGIDTRFFGWNSDLIREAIRNPKKVAIIQVNSSHWVTATREVPLVPRHFFMADPMGNSILQPTTAKYKMITGGAILLKK